MSDKEFDGQVAVVTGGGVGIGFAIAKLFAERGATASIWDIDGDAAAAAAKKLKEAGLKAHSQQLDVTDEAQIFAARDKTIADCGQIDMMVTAITASTRREHHKQRAQSFAAAIDDIRAQLINEGNVGTEAVLNKAIDRPQILGDQIADGVKLHGH